MKKFVNIKKLQETELPLVQGGEVKPLYGIQPLYGIKPPPILLYGIQPLYGIKPEDICKPLYGITL